MDWTLLIPEMTLLVTAMLFLVLACLRPDPQRDYHLGIAMAAATLAASLTCVTMSGDLFNHVYRVDLFSQVVKVLLAMGFFLVILLCDNFSGVNPDHHAEAYFLLAACTLAMMLMASAVHLLALVLALELSRYSNWPFSPSIFGRRMPTRAPPIRWRRLSRRSPRWRPWRSCCA